MVIQGSIIAIGARNANPNGAGAVYVFSRQDNEWLEIAKVAPPDGESDDQFAFAIAISGNTMVVGARRADLPGAEDAGAAYIYRIKANYVVYDAKLTTGNAAKSDQFGQSVAFTGDTIAIGANRDDVGSSKDQGSIHTFRQNAGQWYETSILTATDGKAGDEFGYSIAGTGNYLVSGAHFAEGEKGAAYIIQVKPYNQQFLMNRRITNATLDRVA